LLKLWLPGLQEPDGSVSSFYRRCTVWLAKDFNFEGFEIPRLFLFLFFIFQARKKRSKDSRLIFFLTKHRSFHIAPLKNE
jgi:hypothetical protein